MAIRIPRCGAAPRVAVKSLEKALGAGLPKPYRAFIKVHDGARPEPHRFAVGDTNGSSVHRFIPIAEVFAEQAHLDNVSPGTFPIAVDECGNYVAIDLKADGVVLFWDHETSELTTIAKDFEEFLSILEPFDINDVELNPEDVEEVWVNPNPKKWIDPRDK